MKLIGITSNYGTCQGTFFHVADTALLNQGKPFFIPDFAHPCLGHAQLVVRICRLGRSISERFAHRYYDAVSVACTFTAGALLQELRAKGLPWESAVSFDGAACVGKFVPLTEAGDIAHLTFSLTLNGEPVQSGNTEQLRETVDALIARASRYFMLRQGDYLLTGCPDKGFPVTENDEIGGSIADRELLRFKVK